MRRLFFLFLLSGCFEPECERLVYEGEHWRPSGADEIPDATPDGRFLDHETELVLTCPDAEERWMISTGIHERVDGDGVALSSVIYVGQYEVLFATAEAHAAFHGVEVPPPVVLGPGDGLGDAMIDAGFLGGWDAIEPEWAELVEDEELIVYTGGVIHDVERPDGSVAACAFDAQVRLRPVGVERREGPVMLVTDDCAGGGYPR